MKTKSIAISESIIVDLPGDPTNPIEKRLEKIKFASIEFFEELNVVCEKIRSVEKFLQELKINIPFTMNINSGERMGWSQMSNKNTNWRIVTFRPEEKEYIELAQQPIKDRMYFMQFMNRFLEEFNAHIIKQKEEIALLNKSFDFEEKDENN